LQLEALADVVNTVFISCTSATASSGSLFELLTFYNWRFAFVCFISSKQSYFTDSDGNGCTIVAAMW